MGKYSNLPRKIHIFFEIQVLSSSFQVVFIKLLCGHRMFRVSSLAAVARMPLYKLFVIEDLCYLRSAGAGSVIGQFAVSASDGAYNYGDEE